MRSNAQQTLWPIDCTASIGSSDRLTLNAVSFSAKTHDHARRGQNAHGRCHRQRISPSRPEISLVRALGFTMIWSLSGSRTGRTHTLLDACTRRVRKTADSIKLFFFQTTCVPSGIVGSAWAIERVFAAVT